MICEARLIEGLSDREVRGKFNAARDADYQDVADEARALLTRLGPGGQGVAGAEAKAQATRLRTRLSRIVAIDFFGADSREGAEAAVAAVETQVRDQAVESMPMLADAALAGLRRRTWVTREGVQVDRIASAWLIRRFIDPEAIFRFVPAKGHVPVPGELRFDMFRGEFTHEGDRCTFEVLIRRCGLQDAALAAIAEIVHDIDLKDGKFACNEAPGIARLLGGIAAAPGDDDNRLAKGAEIFDGLYEAFRQQRS